MEGVTVQLTRCGWLWSSVEILWMLGTRQEGSSTRGQRLQVLSLTEDEDERRGENIRMERNVHKGAWAFGSVAQCYVGQWTMP